MKRYCLIGLVLLVALAACHTPTREARRMIALAEQLADTQPDSTVSLIDSVLRMPANLSERQRMDMAFLQAEALFGCRDGACTVSNDSNNDISGDGARTVSTISPVMDDDFFDDKPFLSTSPDLERAAAYYAKKKQYAKAAQAALYSGFVQQHYNEKEAAMQSFKDAERYGGIVEDSLTVAQAQYKMGRLLYRDGMIQEAIVLLIAAEVGFKTQYAEKALTENLLGICYCVQGNYANSEICLHQSLLNADNANSNKVKGKSLNNFAVLYRLQGKYDQALDCLRQAINKSDDSKLFLNYLNMGKVFVASGELDSALYYYQKIEDLLPTADVMNETKVSAYDFLFQIAEYQSDHTKALRWKELHEIALYEVMFQRQEQNVYRVQQQYDYESLQNAMNQKLIHWHRIILLVSIFAILGLAALAVSQIRLAKTRKQEAEAKTNLFHFMQQHKELQQKHDDSERVVMNYEQQLSDALTKEALIIRKLGIYLENKGEKAYLGALNDAVFGGADQWDALMKVFDSLYPGVRENLKLQHPELTEMEQKDFILSYFNVSREDEALMFNKSVHMVDKWRNSVRKKMQAFDAEQRQKN